MIIDVIVLSYAKNDEIIEMNKRCIDSIINSTSEHKFRIFLIETEFSKEYTYPQPNVVVIQPSIEFNYNKFLNIGFTHCENEWILITNNDTIYHKNFLENMLEAHKKDKNILSMSPMDDNWHCHKSYDKSKEIYYGHRRSYEITGWSILLNKEALDKIGKFDENFKFWYQDDDYSFTLQKNNITHALIVSSKVDHLLSKSHDFIENEKKFEMTDGMGQVFFNKWKGFKK